MKAFRGTILSALLLLIVGAVVLILRPDLLSSEVESTETRLFTFEKHELVHVDVIRPDGSTVGLTEKDGQWIIDGTDFVAGRSMVNRVKHQLHDLTARATVIEKPEAPELYGLGDNAIHVKLSLRDGRALEFLAGDPNPSSVSYYIQPLPGEVVYTVKKSAVDYYSFTLDEFRERRFASFDSKDAVGISAKLAVAGQPPRSLEIESVGEREWQMKAPVDMGAEDDRVRRLFGRVSALKASSFIVIGDNPSPEKLAEYGLDAPQADITVRFASREPLRLRVGKAAPAVDRFDALAYMLIEGDNTVYVAKSGLLEEFSEDPKEMRNRRVVRMKSADVVSVDAVLQARPGEELSGSQGVRFAAEQWVWKDGVPVPGSTPERVAQAFADLQVESFVDDAPKDLAAFGLVEPVARVVLADEAGNERVVRVGGAGEPLKDPEGHERGRRYVLIEGDPAVYLVDDHVLSVIDDLIREGKRKDEADADKARRRERIPSAGDPAPAPEAPAPAAPAPRPMPGGGP